MKQVGYIKPVEAEKPVKVEKPIEAEPKKVEKPKKAEKIKPEKVEKVRLTLDSDLNRQTVGADGYVHKKGTVANVSRTMPHVHLPKTLVSDLRVDILTDSGEWENAGRISGNRRRVVYIDLNKKTKAV